MNHSHVRRRLVEYETGGTDGPMLVATIRYAQLFNAAGCRAAVAPDPSRASDGLIGRVALRTSRTAPHAMAHAGWMNPQTRTTLTG